MIEFDQVSFRYSEQQPWVLREANFTIDEGELVVVLEAMKMEQSIYAHRSGIVCNIDAPLGETVSSGHSLLSIVDAV